MRLSAHASVTHPIRHTTSGVASSLLQCSRTCNPHVPVEIGLTHVALARFPGSVKVWHDPGLTRVPGLPVTWPLELAHLHAGVLPRVP
jgi:hypothetical protein